MFTQAPLSTQTPSSKPVLPSTRQIFLRIAAAVLGGYVFTWGLIAALLAGLYATGLPFHDAESLSSMLGFLVYVAVFLWAFAAASLTRVWLVLVGAGLAMAALASLIQSALV